MVSFRKQPKIGREAMFKSKPVKNEKLDWEKTEDEEVIITLTRSEDWKIRLLTKIFWVPKQRKLVLDPIGAQVWDMCNGRTTVETMIRSLSETHKLNLKVLAPTKSLGLCSLSLVSGLCSVAVLARDGGRARRIRSEVQS